MAELHTNEKFSKDIFVILLSLNTDLIGRAVWFRLSYLFIPIAPFHFIDDRIKALNGEYLYSPYFPLRSIAGLYCFCKTAPGMTN